MAEKKPKIFVLDTNVILHNCRAIYAFQENDVVIPITVLEELDKFKKNEDVFLFPCYFRLMRSTRQRLMPELGTGGENRKEANREKILRFRKAA